MAADLLSTLGPLPSDEKEGDAAPLKDPEMPEEDEQNKFMADFFAEVNSIKTGMATIRKNIKQIEDISQLYLNAINSDNTEKQSDELEKLLDATNGAAADVRKKLKDMDKQNKEQKQGTAQWRIRTNMHGTLTKKFLDLMSEYQETQTKYKNKYRERVARQFRIVNPQASEEEIDKAIESGDTQVFARQILDKKHTAAKEALAYIETRHLEIQRLEQSIIELHNLFLDMATLVEAQSELIDQIEYNVSKSVAHTAEGLDNLRQAKAYQKKGRKKLFCLICILVIIFLVLGGAGLIGGLVS